ncbi:MAG TPA: hypothetical protein VFQ72_03830 [Candidatus Paceibacterota bacterium]|nr:hypothetical protein [Candidatus Paceibacterota bacterium]
MNRKLITALLATLVFSLTALAQSQAAQTETVTVKRSDLPADVLAKIEKQEKVQEITKDLRVAQEWSGIGKEIGIAVNDGLKAVTEQTANFAKTDVGKMTMFLIAWKVMAKDVGAIAHSSLGFIIGVPMLIFINCFAVWYYRRTYVGRVIVKSSEGWLWWKKVQYETLPPACQKWEDSDTRTGALIVFWIALFAANCWVIKGCIF